MHFPAPDEGTSVGVPNPRPYRVPCTVYKQSFCLNYQLNDMHYSLLLGNINDLTKER